MRAVEHIDDRQASRAALSGYVQLAADRVSDGWTPYLLTMRYASLAGSRQAVVAQMLDEAEHVYRIFLTRVARRPLSSRSLIELPIVIAAPDLPVGKRGKPLAQVAINDGLHLHAILLVPPRSRLPLPADEHFRQRQALYLRDRTRSAAIDVRPIEGSVERVVDYVLKSVRRGRFSSDDALAPVAKLLRTRR